MKSQRWVPPKNLGWWKVRGGYPQKTFGLMKSQRWAPFYKTWVDESKWWAPLWVDADSKKCQICVVQMAKNLVHSFYHILYQPKGVPIPSHNFSGTGGKNVPSEIITLHYALLGPCHFPIFHNFRKTWCITPFYIGEMIFFFRTKGGLSIILFII